MSLFDLAANVFDGWTDPETGVRVLRLRARNADEAPPVWYTPYHQVRCFLDGGCKVMLRGERRADRFAEVYVLDLTTGLVGQPFPPGCRVGDIDDAAGTAILVRREHGETINILWDVRSGRELTSISSEGWQGGDGKLLAGGRRAIVAHFRGQRNIERVDTHFHLLSADEPPRIVMEAEGYFCNHIQGCPTDPILFAYDRWPSPLRDIEQAIHLMTLDGTLHEPMKMDAAALRPVSVHGVRDHYLWTPDGNRIVSYFFTHPLEIGPDFNHFTFEWWLSATDWRTGEDLAAQYPPGRWGGHMGVSVDSRYVICCGGPGFDKLFAVEIEGLRRGWNEHIICFYPETVSTGQNTAPFPYPFALPDGSGVIFNAGWPGDEQGVYLAEWPEALK